MVADPADDPWSSHRHHAFGTFDPIVSNHPAVTRLDHDPVERRQRYHALVLETVTPEETDAIRLHLQRQHLHGPDRFRRAIEAQLGRSIDPKKIGGPRKTAESEASSLESRL
jgi:putative transposase